MDIYKYYHNTKEWHEIVNSNLKGAEREDAFRKYIKETDFCGSLCQYAKQTINILKTEIDQLKAEKEALINGQETLQKYIMELEKKGNTTMKEITAITGER